MGIMSKNNRMPERPKPPSWTEITEDVAAAQINDVVFSFGQDYLIASTAVASAPYSTGLNGSEVESPNQDAAQVDAEIVKSSKANVLKLIDLYTELNDSLGGLQEQYGHLKHMGEELSHSMSELKVLAQNISTDIDSKTNSSSLDTKTRSSANDTKTASSAKDTKTDISANDTKPDISALDTKTSTSANDTKTGSSAKDTKPDISANDTKPDISTLDTKTGSSASEKSASKGKPKQKKRK